MFYVHIIAVTCRTIRFDHLLVAHYRYAAWSWNLKYIHPLQIPIKDSLFILHHSGCYLISIFFIGKILTGMCVQWSRFIERRNFSKYIFTWQCSGHSIQPILGEILSRLTMDEFFIINSIPHESYRSWKLRERMYNRSVRLRQISFCMISPDSLYQFPRQIEKVTESFRLYNISLQIDSGRLRTAEVACGRTVFVTGRRRIPWSVNRFLIDETRRSHDSTRDIKQSGILALCAKPEQSRGCFEFRIVTTESTNSNKLLL